jgi:hypothetical protein
MIEFNKEKVKSLLTSEDDGLYGKGRNLPL